MTHHTTLPQPNDTRPEIEHSEYEFPEACIDEFGNEFADRFLDDRFVDERAFAEGFGFPDVEPLVTLSEEDLRFLRDFILSSAIYVEQLENLLSEASDDFWMAREHAYRLITNALIGFYEYEMG